MASAGHLAAAIVVLILTASPLQAGQASGAGLQAPSALPAAAPAIANTSAVGGINASVSSVVSTPGTYGSVVAFSTISGLPPGFPVAANSTEITDSSGAAVACINAAVNVSASGTLSSFTVTLEGNASVGPFSLDGIAGGSMFTVENAGIASTPDAAAAELFVYPGSQASGGPVSIFGAGFDAMQQVGYPVVGNQSYQSAGRTSSDENGAFSVSFQLADMPSGNYTVRMSGAFTVTASLAVIPSLQLVPSSGHVGQAVVASLAGFPAGKAIGISWAGKTVKSTRASGQGKAILVLSIPAGTIGEHALFANTTGVSSVAYFTINASTVLLSRYGASPGSTVSIFAEGFSPASSLHLIYNGRSAGTVTTAGNGTGVINFTVPRMTAGRYTVQATSQAGLASNITMLTVRPTVQATEVGVNVGATIQVTGNYYYPSSRVRIYIGPDLMPQPYTSGKNGTLYANITVPVLPGGNVSLGAYDVEGNNATVFTLIIQPHISLSSISGPAGSRLAVSGTGFVPGTNLTLLWNGNQLTQVSGISANGTFRQIISVPNGTPGTYLVSVENQSSNSVVYTLSQYTGFNELLPAILLPLVTAMVASLYVFSKFRMKRN